MKAKTKSHHILNNQCKTVVILKYKDNYDAWWKAQEQGRKIREALSKKYKQWFGLLTGVNGVSPKTEMTYKYNYKRIVARICG